jgi:hypothetical protein
MPTLGIQKISFQQRISALAKNLRRYFLGAAFTKLLYTLNNRYEPYAHQVLYAY